MVSRDQGVSAASHDSSRRASRQQDVVADTEDDGEGRAMVFDKSSALVAGQGGWVGWLQTAECRTLRLDLIWMCCGHNAWAANQREGNVDYLCADLI